MDDTDHYRCRLIYLKQSSDNTPQAEAACKALAGIEGITLAAPLDSHSIHLIYSLDQLSFELITDLIEELGFELDKSILLSLQQTIYQFLDDNARESLPIELKQISPEELEPGEIPHQSVDKYWKDYH